MSNKTVSYKVKNIINILDQSDALYGIDQSVATALGVDLDALGLTDTVNPNLFVAGVYLSSVEMKDNDYKDISAIYPRHKLNKILNDADIDYSDDNYFVILLTALGHQLIKDWSEMP